MGLTYVNGNASGPNGKQEVVRFLIDSGASYSLLPHDIWQKLGLEPQDEFECVLVDGTVVRRKVADCKLSVVGKEGVTRVVLGEIGDDEALLGAFTLEHFGLVLEPFSRSLRPLRIRL